MSRQVSLGSAGDYQADERSQQDVQYQEYQFATNQLQDSQHGSHINSDVAQYIQLASNPEFELL